MGDTHGAPDLIKSEIAQEPDLLVHEATLEEFKEDEAEKKGHSTAGMAGLVAHQINAKNLLLTHFGKASQYFNESGIKGEDLERQAARFFSRTIFVAKNYMCLSIQPEEIFIESK